MLPRNEQQSLRRSRLIRASPARSGQGAAYWMATEEFRNDVTKTDVRYGFLLWNCRTLNRPEHSDQAAEPVRAPRTFARFF
jgi:hypothetical protein